MNLTVSPQMRIVALLGLVAVLGIGGSLMLLGRKQDSASARTAAVQPVRPQSRTGAAVPTKPATKPARPAAPAKPQARPAVKAALAAGLPAQIARAFARHEVVVVELYSADAAVDRLALIEATAGAREAGVGFVAVNVTARRDVTTRALATNLGVRDAPALLVFRRPGTLSIRIDGFSDQETVAQAAANAAVAA
jgi:thiol:disulfide interchange protein